MNRLLAGGLVAVTIVAVSVGLVLRETRTLPSQATAPTADVRTASLDADEPLRPLPPVTGLDPRVVELGRDLFHERLLSRDKRISCASCHDLAHGGADHVAHSIGVGGEVGIINTPTVLNSVFNFRQFWNGRAATLEEQVDGPMTSTVEMGARWSDVVARLDASPGYAARFHALYPDGVTRLSVTNALATFERSLVTPSRFDRYLLGDAHAITEREREGYRIFKSYGCASCHQGVNAGGNMYQHFGVMADYFADRGHVTAADLGRFAVTHDPADRYVFKVPSLRNVALTAPYFHDGTAVTLAEAVNEMGHYQLGRTLTPAEVELLVAFLGSLTGEVPAAAQAGVPTALDATP